MNLMLIFLTGLTTGALSCLAVQGGLLTSVIANRKESQFEKKTKAKNVSREDWLPVGMFLTTKLISHVILGALLGMLGSMVALSLSARVFFQVFTALFMFATAMNLLDVHPIFRYVVIQPPKFVTRRIRTISKDTSLFSPALLGVFTIFIPCGVTQAMAVLAINSGSAVQGALIMGAFVLGTSPLFAIIGMAVTKFSDLWRERFLRVAAYGLILMSLYSLNGALVVLDAPVSAQKIASMYQTVQQYESGTGERVKAAEVTGNRQAVVIEVKDNGYVPNYVSVKRGIPVDLTLTTNGVYSCASAFVFREFGINTMLKPVDSQTFAFTPNKPGRYTFACSMGMYTGVMEVI